MQEILWKLTLAYDGTDYRGWQIQPDSLATPTIQATLAQAIYSVTGEQVLPQGSGRTDAGVHALDQVASFPLAAPIPAENFARALNRILPASIRVLAAVPAPAGFHARHSATGKIYSYRLFAGSICPPSLARYTTPVRGAIDLEAMQQAAQFILGEHDFTSFAATDPDRAARLASPAHDEDANRRRILRSEWSRAPIASCALSPVFAEGSHLLTYTVEGSGFLHHMVRNLVGTFLEIGYGRMPASAIPEILGGRSRTLAGPTAPARGLCLMQVHYPPQYSDSMGAPGSRSEPGPGGQLKPF